MIAMKKVTIVSTLLIFCFNSFAQIKVVENAIIKVKTEMTFPENFNPGRGSAPGDGGGFSMPRDMETNSTMYYTPNYMKVESTSDFGNNIVITDRVNKKTTTLIEAMGRKTGFFSSDAEDQASKAKMDSLRNLRRDSLMALGITFKESKPEITYVDETRKIAGYNCKKAIIKSKGQNGEINESVVWYNPDFKISATSTAAGNTQGFGGGRGRMMMGGIQGLEQIEGFPMEYEITRNNGFTIHMTVLKVQTDVAIDEKTFEIPKGYDLKPMSNLQGGNGEGMRMIFRSSNN
jgi:GLPGLI family protein